MALLGAHVEGLLWRAGPSDPGELLMDGEEHLGNDEDAKLGG